MDEPEPEPEHEDGAGPDEGDPHAREPEQQRDVFRAMAPPCGLEGDAGDDDPGDEQQSAEKVEEERHVAHRAQLGARRLRRPASLHARIADHVLPARTPAPGARVG
jgi:hypothetical protein